MNYYIFFLVMFLSFPIFGKARMVSKGPINKIAPLEKEYMVRDVQWALQDGINGIRAIQDENCKNMSLFSEGNYLKVLVNNKPFFILDREWTINFKKYSKSICYKLLSGDVTQVECISRSLDAIENINEDDKLVFYTKYSSNVILICPRDGTIEN